MIDDLVSKYQNDRAYYITDAYNEAQLRADFLDPLFGLLGWDMQNKQAKATAEREVVVETPLKASAGAATKKPDYAFRLFSERKFFLEAKKPSVNISIDPEPAAQIRRYGFTAKMKISVLSNFEYLAIYDCSRIVSADDSSANSRVKLYHYTEYSEKFDEIRDLLGKESVYSGEFDKTWSAIEVQLQRFSIDDLFLSQINQWRVVLGEQILSHNTSISQRELNDLVQSYLNSIIFLRVCEDRELEKYKSLLKLATEGDFNKLIVKFQQADRKYNSGLFNHKMNEQVIKNNASSFWSIIRELYFPHTSYSFSVISSDILGRIYEVYLGEELTISSGVLSLDKKPEHVDRDIVTTPTPIIRDILGSSLAKQLDSKSADEVLMVRLADIACGSGAFLLEAFQMINDYLIDWYLANEPETLTQISIANYRLPYSLKRQVLEQCIYGVDKDYGAVEACKFGLLLKLLEDEDNASIATPALPTLSNNIQFGNSLVGSDDVSDEERGPINPLQNSAHKFNVIVGNPPYMSTEDMKRFTPQELPIYKRKYKTSYKQFDKYFLFIEQGFELLADGGHLGYIVPSKFMKVGAGQKLREYLSENCALEEVISFGANQVFKDKTTYTCILILQKQKRETFTYQEVSSLPAWNALTLKQKTANLSTISLSELDNDVWVMIPDSLRSARHKLLQNTQTLEDLVGQDGIYNGIQTSANSVYIHSADREDENYVYFSYGSRDWKIEKELTRPYFRTASGDGTLSSYRMLKPNSFVVYPYVKDSDRLSLVGLYDLERNYPHAFYFLNSYKSILSDPRRDIKPTPETPDEWYSYGRHQSLEKCDVDQKIVVGVMSQGDKYAIDTSHTLISSGGTAGYCMITLPEESQYSAYYLQAILSSKYTEWYASLIGEVFRGGYIARGTKVLKRLPIKVVNFDLEEQKLIHDSIANTQQKLIQQQSAVDRYATNPRELALAEREFYRIKTELDKLIDSLYGLGEDGKLIPSIKKAHASN
ncbi:N-6 DNA methylase [Candidatus Saccharibacteria bacterium]|nr:N-6 DNA methylase [Candidatus Saccharibacteria bacterium]